MGAGSYVRHLTLSQIKTAAAVVATNISRTLNREHRRMTTETAQKSTNARHAATNVNKGTSSTVGIFMPGPPSDSVAEGKVAHKKGRPRFVDFHFQNLGVSGL
jgi:hypothetical protein